ncbi:hypothetical protein BDP55DRAFT_128443 [Colletotrichum godetiae]|uniref:Uncharacterized protein n=1 Tax=Colletotrichum godetiae TaxID=1209918 RepID=A0AAJ0AXY4_9PEZI|nr:uncharacterized protein BDP55DRAFT_128443 [Colletotrichum godetiae]KAK1700360.1 hypothetical protein BDP55DRAFT_128443 [Colletotrichum godetiae]
MVGRGVLPLTRLLQPHQQCCELSASPRSAINSYQASQLPANDVNIPPSPRLTACLLTHGPQKSLVQPHFLLPRCLQAPAVKRISHTFAAFLLCPKTCTPIAVLRSGRTNSRPLASWRRLPLNRGRHSSRPHFTSHASHHGWTIVLPPPPSGNSSRRNKGVNLDRLYSSSVFVLPGVYALPCEWSVLACRPRPKLPLLYARMGD